MLALGSTVPDNCLDPSSQKDIGPGGSRLVANSVVRYIDVESGIIRVLYTLEGVRKTIIVLRKV